jgi:hypothetical protein
MDARTRAWLDQQDAWYADAIRRHGCAVVYVGGEACSYPGCSHPPGDQPAFAYSIGLFGLFHPELLIFSQPPRVAALVLNRLAERVWKGEALLPGQIITVEGWEHRIVPEEVPNPGEIVFQANRYYRRPPDESVPVLQLSYDDGDGRFPWEEGYASASQPRPGTFRA